jgi:octaprenyl-diphosphate synthase
VLEIIESQMRDCVAELKDAYVMELFEKLPKGKRLRAKLIMRIASEHPKAPLLAAIVELIHGASLLHDDVIDDALTRRGADSLNALYGNKTSIMFGDILYSQGFAKLTTLPSEVAGVVAQSVALLSLGELQDVELSKAFNPDRAKYEGMIYNKTASLIEASAKAAALLAGKPHEPLALYGKNLGLAFQIIDDILDITQDSQTLGKPAMHDFKEGKTTLPYLYMYEALEDSEKEQLMSYFGKDLSKNESDWIRQKMDETGALSRSIIDAKNLGNEAIESVKSLGIEGLDGVVRQMIERDF